MKVLAIIHGARSLKPSVRRILAIYSTDSRFAYRELLTTHSGHAKAVANEVKSQVDLIILYGGDGLINEVINGLCTSDGANPKLLIIPGGTGNDFIRSTDRTYHLNPDLIEVFNQPGAKVPIPYCKTDQEMRYFLNITDVGFGGHVVNSLTGFRKYLGTNASYILAVLRTFVNYRAKSMRLQLNKHDQTMPLFMVAVCHGSTFGDGMIIAPGKKPNKTCFNVVVFGKISIIDYLKNLIKLKRGIPLTHPAVNYYEASELWLSSTNEVALGETDGEPIQGKSFEFGFSDHWVNVLS